MHSLPLIYCWCYTSGAFIFKYIRLYHDNRVPGAVPGPPGLFLTSPNLS